MLKVFNNKLWFNNKLVKMLLHFLNLVKLACHCHAPSSTELWAANRLDDGPPLECCCTVGNGTREDRNGQEKASDIYL